MASPTTEQEPTALDYPAIRAATADAVRAIAELGAGLVDNLTPRVLAAIRDLDGALDELRMLGVADDEQALLDYAIDAHANALAANAVLRRPV